MFFFFVCVFSPPYFDLFIFIYLLLIFRAKVLEMNRLKIFT